MPKANACARLPAALAWISVRHRRSQITELNTSGTLNQGEVYAGSRHLATYRNATTYFVHVDWLGTERARSTVAGGSFETCTSLPFGDNLTCTGSSDPSPMALHRQERDAESGLDNFGARISGQAWAGS